MIETNFGDPSLTPQADVGGPVGGVTLKAPKKQPEPALEPTRPLDDPAAEGLIAAGFRLKGGAWTRSLSRR